MREAATESESVTFIDPPYTAGGKNAGRRLYTHSEFDHEELFRVAITLSGDFLMTYDNAGAVKELAETYGLDVQAVAMRNTHLAEMKELLIGRDLDWVRRQPVPASETG